MKTRTQLASALRIQASQEGHDGPEWDLQMEASVRLEQDEMLIASMRKLLDETVPTLRCRIEKLQKQFNMTNRDRLFEKLEDAFPGKSIAAVIINDELRVTVEGVGEIFMSPSHPCPVAEPEWFAMVVWELNCAMDERERGKKARR